MDIDDTPEEADFRAEARSWLDAHAIPPGHPAGGSDQVQATIIGDRALGLPPEPRTNKAVPFRDLGRPGGSVSSSGQRK